LKEKRKAWNEKGGVKRREVLAWEKGGYVVALVT
jgi:hypothetical protein